MESNQEKAEGDEWDSEEQTSKLPQRVQLAEIYPGDPFDNLLEAISEFCPPN